MPNAGGLWARVRLQGRRAARWRFQVVIVSGSFKLRGRTAKRPPYRLSLLITRKKRKTRSLPSAWHVTDPTKPTHAHLIVANNVEPMEFDTTLNSRTATEDDGFEDKRWSLILEEVTKSGQRKALASTKINIAELLEHESGDKFFKELSNVKFTSYRGRIEEVVVSLHVAGVLLKTGQATDDDLQSLASMLTTNTLDIGNLDDFSDSISDVSSGFNQTGLSEVQNMTAGLKDLTRDLGGDDFEDSFQNFAPEEVRRKPLSQPTQLTPPTTRKLRPSPLEISTPAEKAEAEEPETVGGDAQELLSWAREATKYSSMVNVTNLTSSFRSGIALGVILKNFAPDAIDLARLNPRMAKNNLRLVLEAFAAAGLDLSGVINVNETATKPDKLAVITALHLIRNKFASQVVRREKKTNRGRVKPETVHSVLFDSATLWSTLAEFRIETLHEEMRRLDSAPDIYSAAVDDILDAFDECDDEPDETDNDELERQQNEIQQKLAAEIENDRKMKNYIQSISPQEAKTSPAEKDAKIPPAATPPVPISNPAPVKSPSCQNVHNQVAKESKKPPQEGEKERKMSPPVSHSRKWTTSKSWKS